MLRPSCSNGSPVLALSRIVELLLGDLPPPVEVDAEHLVLGRSVADGCDVGDTAAADVVEDHHLLGQPHRVVEGQDDDRHHDREGGRAGGHRAGQHQRRREVAVLGGVVLAQDRADAAVGLAPGGHLQRGRVQLGRRCAGGRRSHVEPHHEHGRPPLTSRAFSRRACQTHAVGCRPWPSRRSPTMSSRGRPTSRSSSAAGAPSAGR